MQSQGDVNPDSTCPIDEKSLYFILLSLNVKPLLPVKTIIILDFYLFYIVNILRSLLRLTGEKTLTKNRSVGTKTMVQENIKKLSLKEGK